MKVKGEIVVILAGLVAFGAVADGQKHEAFPTDRYVAPPEPEVREHVEWLQDQKLGLMMHFGLYSTMGIFESWPLVTQDASWSRSDMEWVHDDTEVKKQYYALNRCFNPIRFNASAIAKLAKRCGFKYVTLTTKHHDGFCLWDTKYTDYKTTNPSCPYSTSSNADIAKRLFEACRAESLGIGVYFSKGDFHHEDYWENCGIGRETTRWPTYDIARHPEKWERFKAFTRNQIVELVRDYGPVDMMWLDGAWLFPCTGYDLEIGKAINEARKYQPNLISVDRGANDEYMNIRTPEQCVPKEPLPFPWETCMTMAWGWGYHYDDFYKSPRQLIHLLVDVVAKGGNLALNVGPMPDGRMPRPAVERMKAMGRWLAKNGAAIYGTRKVKPYSRGKWRFTRGKGGQVYAIRLWDEDEPRLFVSQGFPVAPEQGEVVKITHLVTGRDIPFVRKTGAYSSGGVTMMLPADFARDDIADVFQVHWTLPVF